MKLIVVYIVGAGNSGSTVLSMVLGSHSRMVSVGELSKIEQYRAFDLTCTCGAPISRCPFWEKIGVISRVTEGESLNPANRISRLIRQGRQALRHDPGRAQVVRRNLAIYREIAASSGKSIIVDSSKDLVRLCYIAGSGEMKVIPLHLVRDGRAYIDSVRRRGGKSAVRAILRWVRMNLASELTLKKMRILDRTIKVDYKQFATAPEMELERICRGVGVDFEEEMMKYYLEEFHNIAGTKSRFSLRPLEPREDWRKRLSRSARLAFFLLGGSYFNRRFGVGSG